MAAVDDFGAEVYTGGQAGGLGDAEDSEEAFFNAAQAGADGSGDPAVASDGGGAGTTENEDDIYNGFSENGQARGEDDEEEDEVNIVLDTENLDKSAYGRGQGVGRGFRSSGNISTSNFSAIIPGGKYSIGRNAATSAPLKPSQQQQKSIFELDIDSMEEKPWRKPGVDLTDYFNYGFNEDSWRQYCEKQSQMRLEQSMQSKIKVYESSRGEKEGGGKQELPPEIQAMVDGDKRKRSSTSSRRSGAPVQEDWPSRDRGFEHRRRPRDVDTAVVQITGGGDEEEMPTEGMEEYYIPTGGGGYPPSRSGSSYGTDSYSSSSRDDRSSSRRDDDRKRDRDRRDDRRDRDRRSSSRSPSRRSDDRDKDKERGSERRERDKDKDNKDKDKDKERSDRRDREKRKDDRDDRDKEKEDREDYKRKSSSSSSSSSRQEDDERAKRRR